MAKKNAQQLADELLEKVEAVKLTKSAALFGNTSIESQLHELRKNVVRLAEALVSGQSYEHIMERYEQVASSIDSAGLTGLIGEAEITDYYTLIDEIWAAIEREYNK